MPTATAEDLVTTLNNNHNPLDLARQMDVVKQGVTDIVTRLSNGEHGHLENAHRLDLLEKSNVDRDAHIASLVTDRGTLDRRVKTLEDSPADLAKRMDALEARLRTAEGAIGAANLKPAPSSVATPTPITPETPATSSDKPSLAQQMGLTKAPEPAV